MAKITPSLGLTQPEATDNITPYIFYDNFEKLDVAYSELERRITEAIKKGGAMKPVDYANPVFRFDAKNLKYTVTEDNLVLCGYIGGAYNIPNSVKVDGFTVGVATGWVSHQFDQLPLRNGATIELQTFAGTSLGVFRYAN